MQFGHINGNSLIFWGALVLIVLIGAVRRHLSERERQQTLRIALERGANLDPDMLQRLLAPAERRRSPQALMVAGAVTIGFGVGLALLGAFLSQGAPDQQDALMPLLGSGCLFAAVGAALFVASRLLRRSQDAGTPQGPGM